MRPADRRALARPEVTLVNSVAGAEDYANYLIAGRRITAGYNGVEVPITDRNTALAAETDRGAGRGAADRLMFRFSPEKRLAVADAAAAIRSARRRHVLYGRGR
jgi:hypothetical protein